MNRLGILSLLAMGFAALHANALEQQSPYGKIADRNVFQLRAAVMDKEPPPTPKQLPKVTLTGIVTILERPLALITIEGIKSQPLERVMIGEKQAIYGVEVKGIDEMAGVVKILNGDELQILNFEPPKSSGPPPVREVMAPPASAPQAQVRPQATMTPEEQVALIELQRIKYQQEGNPAQAILPPTELTPEVKP